MKYEIIKLNFQSPLHLSRGQTDYYDKSETILHSDTLKSAIYSCAKLIYKDKIVGNDFLKTFSISSAFPFIDDEFFFPKPLLNFNPNIIGVDQGPPTHKKLKKIEYLSKIVFEDFVNGRLNELKKRQVSECGKFVFSKTSQNKELFKSEVQQRLVMPNGNDVHPKPFYVDRLYFNKGAGLFFIIKYNEKCEKEMIINSLKLLSSQGIGTDRNVGNGQFDFTDSKIEIDIPIDSDVVTNLSLYLPTQGEIEQCLNHKCRYSLLKRGGYISNPENMDFLTFRKKSIYMFREGSVFPNANQTGKIEDLKPDNVDIHPIYRDGTSVFIPIIQ